MHYRNGRLAVIGDPVVGLCYNTRHLVAGTLLSVTPGHDACSAKVAWLSTRVLPAYGAALGPAVLVHGTEKHYAGGSLAMTRLQDDYTECKNLLHVDDVKDCGGLLVELLAKLPA